VTALGPDILFCPGDRPDRFGKALDRASALIIDLEDGVGPDAKAAARDHTRAALAELPLDRVVVRVNPPDGPAGSADVAALRETGLRHVMLPKAEDPAAVEALAPWRVIAICETARGVAAAPALAGAAGCAALMWGGEDLIASLGGRRSRRADGTYLPVVTHARAAVLLAAGAAGIAAWDGVYLAIDDLAGLAAEADDAVAMGFAAKVAIHPSHAPVIRAAYAPAAEDVARAREVLEAAARAGEGAVRVHGRMIDGPLLAQARAVVAAAERLA